MKSVWFFEKGRRNITGIEEQVKNILLYDRIDEDYTELSRQHLEDIITCAATTIVRENYSMSFLYTDLDKDLTYMGFQSGMMCQFPETQYSTAMWANGSEGEKYWQCNDIPERYEFFNSNF